MNTQLTTLHFVFLRRISQVMKLFATKFTPSSSFLETNIPLGTLAMEKFHIAIGHLITLEMNVLSA